jgi:four helix bundle protein
LGAHDGVAGLDDLMLRRHWYWWRFAALRGQLGGLVRGIAGSRETASGSSLAAANHRIVRTNQFTDRFRQRLLGNDHAAIALLTRTFPADERFGLVQQMRRAAVSIGSNISEGCGRRGDRELLNSLYVAFGEAQELAYQLRVSDGLAFGAVTERQKLIGDLDRLQRMLNRLTAYLRAHADRKGRKSDRGE